MYMSLISQALMEARPGDELSGTASLPGDVRHMAVVVNDKVKYDDLVASDAGNQAAR